jgi:hypothetical protein
MTRTPVLSLVAFAALATLPGRATAQIGPAPVQFWQQTSPGIDLPPLPDAFLGAALASGDFDGDGFADLAVGAGAPGETIGLDEWQGAVNVFFSQALFLDGFESGDLTHWSAVSGAF